MKTNKTAIPTVPKMGTVKEQAIFDDLLLKPTFQEMVKKLRGKFAIPLKGFKNDDEWLAWHSTVNNKYIEVDVSREVFLLGGSDKPVLSSKHRIKRRIKSYYFDLCKILKQFDLSLEWIEFIDGYIGYNYRGKVSIHSASLSRESHRGVIIDENLQFNFGATMTQKRLFDDPLGRSIWMDTIQPLQALMQGYSEKKRRPKNLKTKEQAKIYKMTTAGLTDEEIYDKLPRIEKIQTIRQQRKRFKNKQSNG